VDFMRSTYFKLLIQIKFNKSDFLRSVIYIKDDHCDELCVVYSSSNIIRVIRSRRLRWAGHVARMGERRSAYRALVGKPEGRRPLGRHRRRWEDNIKMDLRGVVWGGMDWINLAQDRDRWRALVNAVMNLRVP
jgi:hypothetical protein